MVENVNLDVQILSTVYASDSESDSAQYRYTKLLKRAANHWLRPNRVCFAH